MIVLPLAPFAYLLTADPWGGGDGGPGPADAHFAPIDHRSLALSQAAGPCPSHATARSRPDPRRYRHHLARPWCLNINKRAAPPWGYRGPWPPPGPPPPVHHRPAPAPCPGRTWSPARPSRPTLCRLVPSPGARPPLPGRRGKPGDGSHKPPYALFVPRTPTPKSRQYRCPPRDPGGRQPPGINTPQKF